MPRRYTPELEEIRTAISLAILDPRTRTIMDKILKWIEEIEWKIVQAIEE